jgi:hypothetical protein
MLDVKRRLGLTYVYVTRPVSPALISQSPPAA